MRELLYEFIHSQLLSGLNPSLYLADSIALSSLHNLKRSSFGTAYDHSIRVANIVIYEFSHPDPKSVIISLLHDVVEEGEFPIETVKAHFGEEIAHAVQALTRVKIPKHQLDALTKVLQNREISHENHTVRLVKCADRLDNLRDMLQIPSTDPYYQKIPRWIAETKLSIIQLAEHTLPHSASLINLEIAEIEKHFSQQIAEEIEKVERELEKMELQ